MKYNKLLTGKHAAGPAPGSRLAARTVSPEVLAAVEQVHLRYPNPAP